MSGPTRWSLCTATFALVGESAFVEGSAPWMWAPVAIAGVLGAVRWAPRRAPVVAALAALVIYAGALGLPAQWSRLLCASLVVGLLIVAGHRARTALATSLAAVPLVAVWLVLHLCELPGAKLLLVGVTALLLAMAAYLAALSLRDVRSPRAIETGPEPPAATSSGSGHWQGWALVLAAGALPIGEGASWVASALLALVLVLHRHALRDVGHGTPAVRHTTRALGICLGAGVVALALNPAGWPFARELGRVTPFVLAPLFYVAVRHLGPRWLGRATIAFVTVLALSSVTAITQYALNPAADALLIAPLRAFSAADQTHVPGTIDHMVAGGFYFHRLKLAHVLLLGIGVLLARQMFATLSRRPRLVEIVVLAIFGSALLLTFARGAMLGITTATCATALFAARRWRLTVIGGLCAIALVTMAVPSLRSRALSIGSSDAAGDRAALWNQGIEIATGRPIGVGLGAYPSAVAQHDHSTPDGLHAPPHHYAHSLTLSAWAEAGPIGLAAYCWMWMSLLLACVVTLLRAPPEDSLPRIAAAAGLFAVVGMWTVGVTHDVLYHKPVAMTFAALVGCVLACLPVRGDQVSPSPSLDKPLQGLPTRV